MSYQYGKYINNGVINKRVAEEEISDYLSNGWSLGMKPRGDDDRLSANLKREATCLKKYGVRNVHQNPKVKEKTAKTSMLIYGVDNPAKNDDVKQKTRETNQHKYQDGGYHNPEKRYETIIARYGSLEKFYHWRAMSTNWDHVIKKQQQTKKRNGTCNYSKPEEEMYKELCDLYGVENIIRGYRDDRYPFLCDFYIIPDDRFVELNRHWTHGPHPFDPNDPGDLALLEKWKEKAQKSKYYQYAIDNWTVRDPLKFKTAYENMLNYSVRY